MFIIILFAHYVCDFILQTRWMAENKSKRMFPLLVHIFTYIIGMSILLFPFMFWISIPYAVLNGGAHLFIDVITSHLSSAAYQQKRIKLFWSIIGFDQFLHVAILYATFIK